MKKIQTLLTLVLLGVFLTCAAPTWAQASATDAPYILVFDRDNLPAAVEKLVLNAGGELLFWFPEVGIAAARANDANFASVVMLDVSVTDVGAAGRWSVPQTVMFSPEFDEPTEADIYYDAFQWDIRRVGADGAWDDGVSGSHDTVVAVLDTGIDASHPDLAPNVIFEACMQLAGPCAPGTYTHWHGTHVAGTVAAAFDGGKAVGVGPNLGLAAYQIFEPGGAGAYDPVIFWAVLNAASQGFDVINMSLGGYYWFPQTGGDGAAVWTAWNRVMNYATQMGVTIVASAGNGGADVNGALYHIPGDIPSVINVSATGIQPEPIFPQADFYDIPASYTNFGAAVDITAPGGECGDYCIWPYPGWYYYILSTMPGGGYAFAGGTSMASPHVAGAAGLVKDANPGLNARQVKAILKRSADKIGSRQLFGSGMLNVQDAVKAASK